VSLHASPCPALSRRLAALLLATFVAASLVIGPFGASRADAAVLTTAQFTTVTRVAAAQVGVPYRYGGTTPQTGFDCSGYVKYVYSRASKAVPRTAQEQYRASTVISQRSARAGDLVFFHSSRTTVYHVGIYAGAGYLWHAPKPGRRVAKVKIWTTAVTFGRAR
jgi:cell wall-associated NlpC family hydrolase